MSSKFEREEKLITRLQLENKKLKELNRSLSKKLKQLNKGYYKYLYESDTQQEKDTCIKEVAKKICWDCAIGEYKEMVVLNRRWRECQNCGKRGKIKIL
jgi:hypothetical protein